MNSDADGGSGGGPSVDQIQKLNDLMESCPAKAVMSSGIGFLSGMALGLFMTSFENSNYTMINNVPLADLPFKQQMKEAMKDTGKKSFRLGKSFALVGAVYASTECVIESYRAKHDMVNSVSAGCVSGAILSAKAGPSAALFGCAGFAAFSAAIDYFLEGR